MNHPILTDHPRIKEHRAQVEEVEKARAHWRERNQKAADEWQEALKKYRNEARLALLRGDEPPAEPTPPAADASEARTFLDELARLRDEEQRITADLVDELEVGAAAREKELLDLARPLVGKLDTITAELAELVATTRRARTLKERRDGVSPGSGVSDRMLQRVTPADVVEAVIGGWRLLDPVKVEVRL